MVSLPASAEGRPVPPGYSTYKLLKDYGCALAEWIGWSDGKEEAGEGSSGSGNAGAFGERDINNVLDVLNAPVANAPDIESAAALQTVQLDMSQFTEQQMRDAYSRFSRCRREQSAAEARFLKRAESSEAAKTNPRLLARIQNRRHR